MRKAILNHYYGEQEIPEFEALDQIEEAGTYAVKGFDRPVSVEPVTSYGASEIRRQHPSAVFFGGADGRRYYAMQCGEFV